MILYNIFLRLMYIYNYKHIDYDIIDDMRHNN